MNLAGESALVTGATRGIGQAIAMELARRGAVVVGTATTAEGAARITAYFAAHGLDGAGVVMDVTRAESIETALAEAQHHHPAPSVLVNNAGITRDQLLARMKDDDWSAVLDTNLSAIYRLSRACLRAMMKARHGRIVNIASVVAVMGNPGQCNYAAAKAGMIGFTKALAREVGARGITVNAVAPGFIDTDMTRALSAEQQSALVRNIPLNRLGKVEDVAQAVAFLAAPESAYITGETVHVNGGLHMA